MIFILTKSKTIDSTSRGLTLIEVVIYSVLLSVLVLSFIQYAITMHIQNVSLQSEIQYAQY